MLNLLRKSALVMGSGRSSVKKASNNSSDRSLCTIPSKQLETEYSNDDDQSSNFEGSSIGASPRSYSISLGTGNFTFSGSVDNFIASPSRRKDSYSSSNTGTSGDSADGEEDEFDVSSNNNAAYNINNNSNKKPAIFLRHSSSFLRVSDLSMDDDDLDLQVALQICNSNSYPADMEIEIPNFHCASVDPPPGIAVDPTELWCALDDGNGSHAPVAPSVIQALVKTGLKTILMESMWTPDSRTAKLLHNPKEQWKNLTFSKDSNAILNTASCTDVLVWSGKFHHNFYGNDLPAVRAAAVLDMSAANLTELLMDSNRVKEYNAMSLGRQDLKVLQDQYDHGPFGGITKIAQSESRPPMLRKTLQFTSLLHARKLEKDGSYLLVSRAVNDGGEDIIPSSTVLVSEILMGVNWIRPINDNKCLFVSVNHLRSPMVPMMLAKRVGLQAAANFINDLRQCC